MVCWLRPLVAFVANQSEELVPQLHHVLVRLPDVHIEIPIQLLVNRLSSHEMRLKVLGRIRRLRLQQLHGNGPDLVAGHEVDDEFVGLFLLGPRATRLNLVVEMQDLLLVE